MVKVYKSAIDLWLRLLLAAVIAFPFFTGISVAFGLHWLHWHEGLGRLAGALFVGLGFVLVGLLFTFVLPCRYTLSDTALTLQTGAFRRSIALRDIKRIELSCSLWFAPALSVNRVKVVLADRVWLVSPHNRTDFVADLRLRLDQID